MTFYNQLSRAFGYSGTLFNRPPAGTLLLRRLQYITKLAECEQNVIVDEGKTCHYCAEPFKECDRVVPGLGVVVGATDVVKFLGKYWHHGCIGDWYKENANPFQLKNH